VNAAHRDGDGFPLADDNHQPFAAHDAGVKQVPLQHRMMLGDAKAGYSEPCDLRMVVAKASATSSSSPNA